MLEKLKSILTGLKKDKRKAAESEPNNNIRLAATVVMLEAANADETCSKEELAHIEATIQTTFNLTEEESTEILKLANHSRKHEVDLWQFTNTINEELGYDEKIDIIEAVWQIIYTDGYLDKYEDYFVHQLAKLLRLSHNDLITAKMKVKAGC